jgi:uncharacterized membrane protein YgcG
MMAAFSIIWVTFSTVIKAWDRGGEVLDDLHHGDFVMEQLVAGLRSAAFFSTAPDKYGFHLEDRTTGSYENDVISWVTSCSAFMPPDSPLARGLHRLEVTVEDNEDGEDAFAIRAWPHLKDEEDVDVEPWYVSTEIKGIACRVYNFEDEDWDDDWENTNALPTIVEISLFMDPLEEYGDPVVLRRMVEIPVAPDSTQAVKQVEGESGEGAAGESSGGSSGSSGGTSGGDEGGAKVGIKR